MKNIVVLLVISCLLLAGCSQETQTENHQPLSSSSTHSSNSNEHATNVNSDETVSNLPTDNSAVTSSTSANSSTSPSSSTSTMDSDQTSTSQPTSGSATITTPDDYDYVLEFPSDSYPETALHIYYAVENGHSDVCTIDRDGADERRKLSLRGVDTKHGYDRDEWPMAMCTEGGTGASVAYVDPSDNRGAGSWVGHQLSAYEDGEKVLFIVSKPKNMFGNNNATQESLADADTELKLDEDLVVYKNCTEAHEAGVTPLFEGEPGYSKKLDRDGDGVACEL